MNHIMGTTAHDLQGLSIVPLFSIGLVLLALGLESVH